MCPRNYDCFECVDRNTSFCPFEINENYIPSSKEEELWGNSPLD